MKYIAILVCLSVAQALCAQSVELVELQHPAAGPVAPGTSDHEVMVFRLYKNAGSPASNLTQLKVAFIGTATSGDWAAVDLYWDADRSRTVSGGDVALSTASVLTAGKATFSGMSHPIQNDFFNGYDYLVVVDVTGGATVDNTFQFKTVAADVTVSAGTVSASLGDVQSNVQTIRVNNGCEIDVRQNGTSIPSATASHDLGYIPVAGANVPFAVFNTGSGTLNLTGTPIVEVTFTNNCAATVTVQPAATITAGNNSAFTVNVDPVNPVSFSFTLQIENNDFDEFPYIVQCYGSATPLPEISIEYNSNPVADGGVIALGSYTAGLPANLNFTIYNTGPGALNLNGTPIVDFPTQQNVNCTVPTPPTTPVAATSGSTSFTVQFTPAGGGNWTFTIWIESNDANESPYNIQLNGSSPAVTATKLGIFRQPGNASATVAFGTQPIVSVQDANGAVNTSDNTTVIVAAISGGGAPGATLGGTLTATCVNGYATFTNLKLNKAGLGYTLSFTDQSSVLTAVVSAPFDVGPAPNPPKKNGGGGGGGGGCSTDGTGLAWMTLCAALCALITAIRTRRA
jgi:hypothetical protein